MRLASGEDRRSTSVYRPVNSQLRRYYVAVIIIRYIAVIAKEHILTRL